MKIKSAIGWIIRNPMDIISAAALTISILLTTFNALTRYCFRYTWNPSLDIIQLCFAYTVFCGSASAYKRKMHYGIDIVISKLSPKMQQIVGLFTHMILLFSLGYATYLSVDLMLHVGGKVLTSTKISYAWFDLSAVLGFAYMTFYELQWGMEDLKKFLKAKEDT